MINYLSGKGDSHLEVGFGFIPGTFSNSEPSYFFNSRILSMLGPGKEIGFIGTATLGYRFQPRYGGVVFRIGLTPWFTAEEVLPWVGVSIGVAF